MQFPPGNPARSLPPISGRTGTASVLAGMIPAGRRSSAVTPGWRISDGELRRPAESRAPGRAGRGRRNPGPIAPSGRPPPRRRDPTSAYRIPSKGERPERRVGASCAIFHETCMIQVRRQTRRTGGKIVPIFGLGQGRKAHSGRRARAHRGRRPTRAKCSGSSTGVPFRSRCATVPRHRPEHEASRQSMLARHNRAPRARTASAGRV